MSTLDRRVAAVATLMIAFAFPQPAGAIHESPSHACYTNFAGYWIGSRDGSVSNFGTAIHIDPADRLDDVVGIAPFYSYSSRDGVALARGSGEVVLRGRVTEFIRRPGMRHLVGVDTVFGLSDSWWVASSDGAVHTSADPWAHYGSMAGRPLNSRIVGIAVNADASGYWLVAEDGGVFAFGDATFHGSMGGKPLNAPIVGMADSQSGHGYWLVASDGGVFAFGDAQFRGSMGGLRLNRPVVGIAGNSDDGYWLVGSDGGIFAFGRTGYYGSMPGRGVATTVIGLAGSPGSEQLCE